MVFRKRKKVSQLGKTDNSASLPRRGNVITRVVSFLKPSKKKVLRIKIPKTHRVGKVTYTVQSQIEPVTFSKQKNAKLFKHLLEVAGYTPDIIRREVTDEGYEVTYENGRKV